MWGTLYTRFRALKRDVDRMSDPVRTRRKRAAHDNRPIGPRLVRGRGLARRRRGAGIARMVVYVLIAAALIILLSKTVLLPFLVG